MLAHTAGNCVPSSALLSSACPPGAPGAGRTPTSGCPARLTTGTYIRQHNSPSYCPQATANILCLPGAGRTPASGCPGAPCAGSPSGAAGGKLAANQSSIKQWAFVESEGSPSGAADGNGSKRHFLGPRIVAGSKGGGGALRWALPNQALPNKRGHPSQNPPPACRRPGTP